MSTGHAGYPYSALPKRPRSRWPNGKGLAVYVALGVEEYRPDEGMVEDLMPGASKPDLVNRSWRDYGNRVGAFRIVDRLAQFGIAPALLLNTDVYDTAPDVVEVVRAAGGEIVAHGLSNSDTLATMGPEQEGAYIAAVMAAIAQREGAAPGGWSSPWLAHSPTSLATLAACGIRYIMDFRLDDQPVRLATPGGPLLAMPYALEVNDSTTAIGRFATGRDFADMVVDEFDEMLAASREQALVMSVVVHSFISGQPFRLRALSRALEHMAGHRDVWFALPREIAAAVGADPKLAV